MTTNHHRMPIRIWVVGAAIAGLIAAHAVVLMLVFRAQPSVAFLVVGVLVVLAMKYAWWRSRSRSSRANP
jgi:hypothetical protein